MNKKLMIMAVCLIAFSTTKEMRAQEKETKHEVAIGYGAGANSTIISGLEDVTTILSTLGSVRYDDASEFGTISAEYFYHATNLIGVGGVLGYAHHKSDMMILGKKEGTAKTDYFTVMPAAKFEWIRKKHFAFYSKVAVGLTLREQKQECNGADKATFSDVLFNWQVSPVGIELGSPNIRVFGELGMGELGILAGGLRYKF